MVADIVIFDPENVTEQATYSKGKNGLPSTGIPYVLVNGTIVVEDSKVLRDVNPGQAIRFPVEEEGRFVPAGREQNMGILTPDTGTTRPTLIEDITDDQASLDQPLQNQPFQRRLARADARVPKVTDWFAQANGPDDSELFLCVVHGIFENRETAQRDWAQAVAMRMGKTNAQTIPLATAKN